MYCAGHPFADGSDPFDVCVSGLGRCPCCKGFYVCLLTPPTHTPPSVLLRHISYTFVMCGVIGRKFGRSLDCHARLLLSNVIRTPFNGSYHSFRRKRGVGICMIPGMPFRNNRGYMYCYGVGG